MKRVSKDRNISKMGHHSDQHFKGADTNKESFLDLAEFTTHAEHKLTTLDSGQPKKKRSKK